MRFHENSTSSALKSRLGVKLALLWNLTPLRSLNVYVLPSGETVHDSASAGTMLVLPSSNCTIRLNMGTDAASKVVPVVKNCGWNPSGLPSEQNTRVPFAAASRGSIKENATLIATLSGRKNTRVEVWSMGFLIGDGDDERYTAARHGALNASMLAVSRGRRKFRETAAGAVAPPVSGERRNAVELQRG